MSDSADLGIISRTRTWWSRIPWQELTNRLNPPVGTKWGAYQGVPRVTFVQPKDKLDLDDLGDLQWPANVANDVRPLPCLTTPSEDPKNRPAACSCQGKVASDTQTRRPWQQTICTLARAKSGELCLPTAPSPPAQRMGQLPFRQATASSPCQRVAPWRRQVVFHFGGLHGAARSSISRRESRALRARRDRF